MNSIFIPSNVASSKNSKNIFKNKHTGKMFISSSDLTKEYILRTELHWVLNRPKFLKLISGMDKPLHIEFQFVRASKRRFDFVNLLQLPLDCMVKYEWIDDDDTTNIVPVINPKVLYSKDSPGLFIKHLNK